jgi:hypothetical protein
MHYKPTPLPVFALCGHTVLGTGNPWHKKEGFSTFSLSDKQALSETPTCR